MEILSETLDVVGKVMIAFTAIAVHFRVWKEHKIDEKVFKSMKLEQIVGIIGVVFIIAAYVIKLTA